MLNQISEFYRKNWRYPRILKKAGQIQEEIDYYKKSNKRLESSLQNPLMIFTLPIFFVGCASQTYGKIRLEQLQTEKSIILKKLERYIKK